MFDYNGGNRSEAPHSLPQVGIVGLPNVGKSTLFNTITKMGIPADNFPFCTIDPNNVIHFTCAALHCAHPDRTC